MAQPKDARLTRELAREVCQRTASAATCRRLNLQLGQPLRAGPEGDEPNGDLLTQEQETANGKEQVLKALGEATTKMRERLGESPASVQTFDRHRIA